METYAYEYVREAHLDRYYGGSLEHGVPSRLVDSREDARRFVDFALWTAVFSTVDRSNSDVSWTDEFPYNSGAGNTPPENSPATFGDEAS